MKDLADAAMGSSQFLAQRGIVHPLIVLALEDTASKLYRNDGGTFTDVTTASELDLTRENNISAAFGDHDRDGG